MTAARHKAAVVHKTGRRLSRFALPALAAAVVTSTVVGVSVATVEVAPTQAATAAAEVTEHVDPLEVTEALEDRRQRVSRAAERVTIEEIPKPVGHRFATAPLNLRVEPSDKAKVVTVVEVATKLFVTGARKNGFAEVVRGKRGLWVSSEYLAKNKPKPEKEETDSAESAAPAATGGTCTAAPPSGVTADAMDVYEAVCSAFPSITTYGGWRGDGEHVDGTSVDVMVSGELGWQVAEFLLARASSLGLYDIIYSQRIWTAERGSEGWRPMSDRGSATANHYDHVHVKVFG